MSTPAIFRAKDTMISLFIIIAIWICTDPCPAQTTWYVPDDFPAIQRAITDPSVVDGDTVVVRPGTYKENIDFLGKAITLKSEQGPQHTIIDGKNPADPDFGSVVLFQNGEGEDSVLEGFMLRSGSGTKDPDGRRGGGIYCNSASPAITGNLITGNMADRGGGIYLMDSASRVNQNEISNNTASYWGGGGVYCNKSAALFIDNHISNNWAYRAAGIHLVYSSDALLINNTIMDNESAVDYGAVSIKSSSPNLTGNTITNNSGGHGAGIWIEDSSTPILTSNIISENTSSDDGGGIYCDGSQVVLDGNDILVNNAGYGGGIFCTNSHVTLNANLISGNSAVHGFGGVNIEYSEATLTGNAITQNTASFSGGISIFASIVELTGNMISENSAYSRGGIAIGYGSATASVIMTGNVISKNTAFDYAGGFFCSYCNPMLTENVFTGNKADKGGAIFVETAAPTLERNIIAGNSATLGGGIYCRLKGRPKLVENVIMDNQATYGGGIYCDIAYPASVEWAVITRNTIGQNSALNAGGGVYCFVSFPILQDNLISGNESPLGGGFYCDFSDPILTNNTFSNNLASAGGGFYCTADSCPVITNTIFWDDEAPSGAEIFVDSGNPVVTYSNVEGGYPGTGNIDADPLFVDPQNGDFHIRYPSPCRDAGNNGALKLSTADFDNNPRISGGTADIGADEFHILCYQTGDAVPGGAIQIKFIGNPGTSPFGFWWSHYVLEDPLPSQWGDWYLGFPLTGPVNLGSVPAPDGLFVLHGILPSTPPGPYSLYLQALIGDALSNLCTVSVE